MRNTAYLSSNSYKLLIEGYKDVSDLVISSICKNIPIIFGRSAHASPIIGIKWTTLDVSLMVMRISEDGIDIIIDADWSFLTDMGFIYFNNSELGISGSLFGIREVIENGQFVAPITKYRNTGSGAIVSAIDVRMSVHAISIRRVSTPVIRTRERRFHGCTMPLP